jgi:hypothetical protein
MEPPAATPVMATSRPLTEAGPTHTSHSCSMPQAYPHSCSASGLCVPCCCGGRPRPQGRTYYTPKRAQLNTSVKQQKLMLAHTSHHSLS